MKWDVSIGGLPFLFATNQQNLYRRETAEFRRQRIDQEREVGEQSLDSGYWLRSQASFHMGSGIASAEPLSVPEDEAKFRFNASHGVDVWTPGELKLLNATHAIAPDTATGSTYGGALGTGEAVLSWYGSTLSATVVFSGGAAVDGVKSNPVANPFSAGAPVTSTTTTGTDVLVSSVSELAKAPVDLASGLVLQYNGGTDITFVRWLKQRLIVADGADLVEITDLSPVSPPVAMPSPFYTHASSGWHWTDAAEGPEAMYVSGYANDTSSIYMVTVTDNAGVLELGTPTQVVDMPRGERVVSLYAYLGSYIVVGTNKGVRVAQIRQGGTLALGPLLVETSPLSDGCVDAVAIGRYVYVTVGFDQDDLWRIDLGQPLDGDLRFAVAADLDHVEGGLSRRVFAVTYAFDRLFYQLEGSGLVMQRTSLYRDAGWLETGRIRMGTLQPKAWRDATLMRVPDVNYADSMEARLYTSSESVGPWTLAAAAGASGGKAVTGDITDPALGPDLYVRLEMQPTLAGSQVREHSPVVTGYQVSSIPAPARSRLVQVPVAMFDWERDRNGAVAGRDGYSWERLSALESLESGTAVVPYVDKTTGESADCYIERVTFTRMTPPFRGENNAGGVAMVLLRVVG